MGGGTWSLHGYLKDLPDDCQEEEKKGEGEKWNEDVKKKERRMEKRKEKGNTDQFCVLFYRLLFHPFLSVLFLPLSFTFFPFFSTYIYIYLFPQITPTGGALYIVTL